MTFSHYVRSTFLAVVTALSMIALASISMPASAAQPAPDQSATQYEVRFMQEMIDHHSMAVQMGTMCLERAVHQELRAMCQEIISAQQQEISTMQQWLLSWYGVSYQPSMNGGMRAQMEKLSMLNNAEFEIEFMQQMIRHHKMAIVKASQCLDKAYHPQLQDMCQNIVSAQLAEIRKMQEWLCRWYGMCRPRQPA